MPKSRSKTDSKFKGFARQRIFQKCVGQKGGGFPRISPKSSEPRQRIRTGKKLGKASRQTAFSRGGLDLQQGARKS